jgi:hypothetical protein
MNEDGSGTKSSRNLVSRDVMTNLFTAQSVDPLDIHTGRLPSILKNRSPMCNDEPARAGQAHTGICCIGRYDTFCLIYAQLPSQRLFLSPPSPLTPSTLVSLLSLI